MVKKVASVFLILLFIMVFMSSVCAITGSIGNARMILRAETGDKIEKYILVKNTNDIPVNIELSVSGDLEKDIEIKDAEFSLGPNEKKKAYFVIKVREEGTTETKINVKFSPVDEGNGVGLSSTVIVIAEKGSFFDLGSDNADGSKNKKNLIVVAFSITGVLLLIFLGLFVFALKKKMKEEIKIKLKRGVRK